MPRSVWRGVPAALALLAVENHTPGVGPIRDPNHLGTAPPCGIRCRRAARYCSTNVTRVVDGTVTVAIEFGQLNDAQWVLVGGHPLATTPPVQLIADPDVWVAVFSCSAERSVDDMYDELRGWALGNGLPIRRVVGD
jgi:hypothetical protein